MPVSLVLTATGPDRSGLIDALSTTLAAFGANWQESRMVTLGGQFAGLLWATVPEARLEALRAALVELQGQGLTVQLSTDVVIPLAEQRRVRLEITGQDRPGIIKEISHALATRGVSIEELESTGSSASWSGEVMFTVTAELRVPAEVATERLREVLEALGNELMVDVTVDEEGPTA